MCNDDDDSIMYRAAAAVPCSAHNMIKPINVFSLSRVIVPNVTVKSRAEKISVDFPLIEWR